MIVSGSGTLINQVDHGSSLHDSQSPTKKRGKGHDPFTPPDPQQARKKSMAQ